MKVRPLDRALDYAVAPGFSRVGYAVRRRTWPNAGRIDADLTGRTVVITGATSGLGKAAAIGIAQLGAHLVLIARDAGRGQQARQEIQDATGNVRVDVIHGDLSSLASVRTAAEEITRTYEQVHVLVNDAGAMPPERSFTDDGLEVTFATNVAGMFLLTELLRPLLVESAPARIINVSSGGMYTRKLDLGDLQAERADPFSGTRAYALTKRAEVVLTELWAEQLEGTGVTVHSMHPGWADTPGIQASLPGFRKLTRPILRSAEEGADTIVWLAAAEAPARTTGLFWHDRQPRPTHRLPKTRETPDEAEELYAMCVKLSGLRTA